MMWYDYPGGTDQMSLGVTPEWSAYRLVPGRILCMTYDKLYEAEQMESCDIVMQSGWIQVYMLGQNFVFFVLNSEQKGPRALFF